MCVVPERMIPEHCTYGRALCKRFECNGLLDAIKRLKQYEKMVFCNLNLPQPQTCAPFKFKVSGGVPAACDMPHQRGEMTCLDSQDVS